MLKTTKMDMALLSASVLEENYTILSNGYALPALSNGKVEYVTLEKVAEVATARKTPKDKVA
jgi:hypothetical protein